MMYKPTPLLYMNKLIIFMVATLMAGSCGTGNGPSSPPEEISAGLPPSLQTGTHEPDLIRLSGKEQKELRIQTHRVENRPVNFSVTAPGVVFPAPEHSSLVSTPIDGQILRIHKFEGERVRKGELLFEIQSLGFGNMVSEYLQAQAEEGFQRNRLTRLEQLVEENISSASELERADAEYKRASAIARAAYSRLSAIGVTGIEAEQFSKGENVNPLLHIHSSIDGVVESHFVELGQSVNALEKLSRLLDIRKVLVRGYLSPDDARLVSAGDSVFITRGDGQPGISAAITSVNPGLDENNRSVVVNVVMTTEGGWPKPGENLRLEIRTASRRDMIAIPPDALTYDGSQAVVFVSRGMGVFEKRPVRVSAMRDQQLFLDAGLSSGDEIAVTGVFSLKALLRFHIMAEE